MVEETAAVKPTQTLHIAQEHVNVWAKRFLTSLVAEGDKGVTRRSDT